MLYITDNRYTFVERTCYILPTTDRLFVEKHAIYYRQPIHICGRTWYIYYRPPIHILCKNMLYITDNRYTFVERTCYILPTTDTHFVERTCYILPTTDTLFVEKHAIYYRQPIRILW